MIGTLPPDDDGPGPNPDDNDGKPGRPPKLTQDLLFAVVRLLLLGNFRCVVARRVGVDPATFRRWMALGRKYRTGIYAQFSAAVVTAEAAAESESVAAILSEGRHDVTHLEWFLERKYPQRWGRFRGELGQMKKRIAELEKLLGMEAINEAAAEAAQ